jgi:hypothetical protein
MRISQAPAPYSLAYYEAQAKTKPIAALEHAARDIGATLPIYRERDTRDPYVAKLLAEMDAVTFELARRRRLSR